MMICIEMLRFFRSKNYFRGNYLSFEIISTYTKAYVTHVS